MRLHSCTKLDITLMDKQNDKSKSHAGSDLSRFWRIPEGNCELLVAKYSKQVFGRHSHDRYAIGVIVDGAEKLYYRGTHWYGSVGSVVSITPGEIHDGAPAADGGWTYRMLYVDPGWLSDNTLCGHLSSDHIHLFREPMRHDPQLAQAVLYAHRMIESACSPLERETILSDVLVKLFGRTESYKPSKAGLERDAVRRVKEKLAQEFDKNVTLAELGALVNMDPLYLIRVFRRETGIPPHSYQLQERVSRAQQLLRAGANIVDVSLFCGFSDQSHMHRTFKKIVGVTPGAFKTGK